MYKMTSLVTPLQLLILICLPLFSANADPTLAGSIAGDFNVSQSGAATYTIPLSLPPATAKIAPEVSLAYDSNSGSGLMGPGWSMTGLSQISRCPATSADDGYIQSVNFTISDRLCLDGQKLVAVSGTYGSPGAEYRTLSESFSKIVSQGSQGTGPQSFIVYQKSGLIYEYGTSSNALVIGPNQNVLSWHLNKVRDRSGNYYTVTYSLSYGQNLPQRIDYTGNASQSLAPYNSVRFQYVPVAQTVQQYVGGFAISSHDHISRIEMYNGQAIARDYRFTYALDALTQQDHITRIEECDSAGVCLPSSDFTWGAIPTQLFNNQSLLQGFSPNSGSWTNTNIYPVIFGDWNGDGSTDFGRVASGVVVLCYSSNGIFVDNDCDTITDLSPVQGYSNNSEYPIFTGDWNGDGLADIARVSPTAGVKFYVSNGYGFNFFGTLANFSPQMGGWTNSYTYPLVIGDWNGDGLTDIGRVANDVTLFCLGSPTGFSTNSCFSLADFNNSAGYSNNSSYPIFTGDWNGDGRTDVARVSPSVGIKFYVSTGSGFSHFANLAGYSPQQGGWTNSDVYPLAIGDWNGDGLTDFGRVSSTGVSLCTSSGVGFSSGDCFPLADLSPAQGFTTENNFPLFTGDFNGDGMTDIGRVTAAGIKMYYVKSNYFSAPITFAAFSPAQGCSTDDTYPLAAGDWNGDGFTDMGRIYPAGFVTFDRVASRANSIVKIKNGFEAETNITYSSLGDLNIYSVDNPPTYPEISIASGLEVVASVSSSNGIGGWSVSNFNYTDLRYNAQRRVTEGFATVVSTDVTSGLKTTKFFRQDYPFIGLPYKSETELADQTLIHSNEDDWHQVTIGTGAALRRFVYSDQSREETYELDGTFIKATVTDRVFNSSGNQTLVSIERSDGTTEVTNTTYNNDTNNWLIGQALTVAVTKTLDGSSVGAITRRTSFSYVPTTGLLNQEIIEPNNAQYRVTKTYGYDGFGNINSKVTSGNGVPARTENTTYDVRGQLPVIEANAIGQAESRAYDLRHGLVSTLTGPNQISTSWTYDPYGRAVLEQRADLTQTTKAYLVPTATAPPLAKYSVRSENTGSAPVLVYYDELSREIRTETIGFNGQRIFVDKVYDDRGFMTHQSDPYFENQTPLWTAFEYDVLGRQTRQIAPGNRQTVIAYNGLTTTITNPLNQVASQTIDEQGRVILSTDHYGNQLSFEYDSYGNLIETVDPSSNTITMQYNLQGKKTRLTDPDTGVTNYVYDVLGQLVSETNSKNETISYQYDNLGRMISRTRPEGTETWTYDTGTAGIGKLRMVAGLNGYQETYTYDTLGRLANTVNRVHGSNYTFIKTYDSSGRVSTIRYPSGFTVRQNYNSFGYLSEIRRVDTNALVWRANSRNARGQLSQQTLGNNLVTNLNYNANTGYISSIQTGTVQNLSFVFDALGNLTQRTDGRIGIGESFAYDQLNRLITTTVTGRTPVSIAYNALGNIISRSDVGTYHYNQIDGGPHAVTSITGVRPNVFDYDNAGNRITNNNGTISFSSTGKPLVITNGSKRVVFELAPDDSRFFETVYNNNVILEKKLTLSSIYEERERGIELWRVHYINSPDGPVAVYTETKYSSRGAVYTDVSGMSLTPSNMKYLLVDHLGSIQTIVNAAGAISEVLSFNAWGERRDPVTWMPTSNAISSELDRGFTAHEHLDSVSLIHMNGRVYDPVVGRFVSADPFIQDPTNLQSLNRYSYVLNNPLSLTDPSGYFSFKKFWKKALGVLKTVVKTAIIQVATYIGNVVGGPIGASFMNAFTSTLLNGGSISQAFHAGIHYIPQGFIRFAIDNAIGSLTQGLGDGINALAHGLANGAQAAIHGGSFSSGFLSGSIGALGGNLATGDTGRIIAILSGGTAAAVSGGKFEEGATAAAFSYMYNKEGHEGNEKKGWFDPIRDLANQANSLIGTVAATVEHLYKDKASDYAFGKRQKQINNRFKLAGQMGKYTLVFDTANVFYEAYRGQSTLGSIVGSTFSVIGASSPVGFGISVVFSPVSSAYAYSVDQYGVSATNQAVGDVYNDYRNGILRWLN